MSIISDIIFSKYGVSVLSSKISTDTRLIEPGSIFLGLKGNNFDGNNFVEDAYKKGAVCAIIDKNRVKDYKNLPIPIIGVDDTLKAYQEIAREFLFYKKLKKIAVTGSSGKTTTKEFISSILSKKYKVFANQGNLNNQIGVPYSILNIKDEEVAVIEMGTGKPGDIKKLAEIFKPDIGVVTSVGEAHIEFFGNLEEIAKEKASITCFGAKGVTTDKICFKEIFKNYDFVGLKIFSDIIENKNNTYDIKIDKKYFNFKFWGEYNLYNLALSVYIANLFGISEDEIIQGINEVSLPKLRGQTLEISGVKYILDCYNANPLSVKESLKSFSNLKSYGRKIGLLGDMLELGKLSEKLHKDIGIMLNELNIDVFILFGNEIKNTYNECNKEKYFFDNIEELKTFLNKYLKPNDTVLVKGSRGMALERIVQE